LHALLPRLGACAARAGDLIDSDIGAASVIGMVATGRHATQYTRLFRS
jgi:urease accessory protein UreF